MLFLPQISIFMAVAASLLSLVMARAPKLSKLLGFIALGVSGLAAAGAGIGALLGNGDSFILAFNSGFTDIFWRFKLDYLSGFFFVLLGIVVFSLSFYGPFYLSLYEKEKSLPRMMFFTGFFVVGMYLVLLAADVFSFIFSWEIMSFASYFLVAYHHEHTANSRAAFIYILMAHLSGLLILVSFGIFIKFGHGFDFASFAKVNVPPLYAHIAFWCAFLGFGMKAGIVPLHVWLPRAHPVAPAHISALMSGVMLKVALYGLMRFCFDLFFHNLVIGWGIIILFFGAISALFGILSALFETDLKKLLAYSSIENMGLIFIGLGLAVIFFTARQPLLGALSLLASFYHALNHSLFKSLLFLGAGAIFKQTGEQDLEKMGGLIHKMPQLAFIFLLGCMSIAALPPFNGFVSEWLTLQASLQSPILQSGILRVFIAVVAALLVLTSALAVACFVKVYGVAFLGRERAKSVKNVCDPSFGMRFALWFLAILCLFFGIFPAFTIKIINVIPKHFFGVGLESADHWFFITPIKFDRAVYNAPLILMSFFVICLVTFLALRFFYKKKLCVKKVIPWDCGFGGINARMQYTATAFSMPLRRVFQSVWRIKENTKKDGGDAFYDLKIEDRFWVHFYLPLGRFVFFLARVVAHIQGGNIRIYLTYIFFTLIALLWIVR